MITRRCAPVQRRYGKESIRVLAGLDLAQAARLTNVQRCQVWQRSHPNRGGKSHRQGWCFATSLSSSI